MDDLGMTKMVPKCKELARIDLVDPETLVRVYPYGIELVIVNGKLAVRGGEIVEAHAGRVLRRGAA